MDTIDVFQCRDDSFMGQKVKVQGHRGIKMVFYFLLLLSVKTKKVLILLLLLLNKLYTLEPVWDPDPIKGEGLNSQHCIPKVQSHNSFVAITVA